MRKYAPCVTCFKKQLPSKSPIKMLPGELDDRGIIYVNCSNGHKSAVIYKTRRYKLLLDSGARALIDGYTNESIATFAAALERAYEFYLRVLLRGKGISKDIVDSAWKSIASQSERQFGAFHILFLLENKITLDLNPDISMIRNRTIHQGHVALEQDAITFGRLVYERIFEIEKTLDPYQNYADQEEKDAIELQKTFIPSDIEYMVMEVTPVLVDKSNQARVAENFSEFLSGVVHAMQEEDRISK